MPRPAVPSDLSASALPRRARALGPLLAVIAAVLLVTVSSAPVAAGSTEPATEDAAASSGERGGVVYRETFDAEPTGTYRHPDLDVTECAGRGRCLRATYRPTSYGSPRIVLNEDLPAASEYTLEFDVRFAEDFEWVGTGKLPGLFPANSINGGESNEADGWSSRLIWRRGGKLVNYLYHQDREGKWGDDVADGGFTLQRGRWYRLGLHVKVNSSGSASDGSIGVHVDGREVGSADGLRLRGTDSDGLIEQVGFHTFYGGTGPEWAPSRVNTALFDDLVVTAGAGGGAEPEPSEPDATPSPSEPEATPSPSEPEATPTPAPTPSEPDATPTPSEPDDTPTPARPRPDRTPADRPPPQVGEPQFLP